MKELKKCFIFYVSVLIGLPCFLVNAATPGNNPSYQRLEKVLPLYQAAIEHPWPQLNNTEDLKLGMQNPAVLLLRQRLCATQELSIAACSNLPLNGMSFDEEIEEAVVLFQERHGLIADGVVGKTTFAALNVSPILRVHQIQLNLQRWSRLISLAEPAYIWINVPDHYLRLIKDQHPVFVSRVIVGKPSRQTPEINSKVTRIVLNPYWTVPPGIARNDVIPNIIRDKNYLQQHRMRVFSASQPNKVLNPNEIDWLAVKQNPSQIILRQDPGPHNALGQIKFEFSNPYLVYLHDTPAKHLFDKERRLFSSGCVRMEDPFDFLEALVGFDPSLKQEETKIEAALESGKTVTIHLKRPIPIHLTYITAWADKTGRVHFWDDVYGRDPIFSSNKEKLESNLPVPV